MLIPRNTSILVARLPIERGTKKKWDTPKLPLPIDNDNKGHIGYDRIVKKADLVNANTTEEDKVKAMITQSSQEYEPSKYLKTNRMTGPLPPNYTCFKCGKQGHWIKNCPITKLNVKRSTGIPRSFLVPVDGPEHKGALLTSSGDYAVPRINQQAYKVVKKEKPPFVPQEEPVPEPETKVPDDLLCKICKELLQDAVTIPCCGNSSCDECVRQVLLESENHECPVCHDINVSPNTLIPNRFLRISVLKHKNEAGSTTRVKKAPLILSPNAQKVASTVESQSQGAVIQSEVKKESSALDVPVKKENFLISDDHASGNGTPKDIVENDFDFRPGTPLVDEPPTDGLDQNLPTQTSRKDQYNADMYEYFTSLVNSSSRQDNYEKDSLAHRPINTIEDITNTPKGKFGHLGPVYNIPEQYSCQEDRSDSYYHRYERRYTADRVPCRYSHYDEFFRDSRYTSSSAVYYSLPQHDYNSHAAVISAPYSSLLSAPQSLLPQPPAPDSSSIFASHMTSEPPPPGVGPLLPSNALEPQPIEIADLPKDAVLPKERSNKEQMEEFQRKLETRRLSSREIHRRSRSRSSEDVLPRSAARARLHSTSNSCAYSSHSSSRSFRAKSRTHFSSRSRSRSRSWSKKRSYSRSECHSRTETSVRRRAHCSRDRAYSPVSGGQSRSYSSKSYRVSSYYNSNERSYTQYSSGASYQSQCSNVPGYAGERSKDDIPRYRQTRDNQVKRLYDEIPLMISKKKRSEPVKTLLSVENIFTAEEKASAEPDLKTTRRLKKVQDEKQRHKRHKTADQALTKKKAEKENKMK